MKNKVIRRIIELCEERQISFYRLAQLSHMSKTTLNNMIAQNKMPTIPSIEKICKGLDITLAQFFSSEKLFPDVTEEQQELLLSWESLRPEDRNLVKAYMKMMEAYHRDQTDEVSAKLKG